MIIVPLDDFQCFSCVSGINLQMIFKEKNVLEFSSLNLSKEMNKAISSMGFNEATEIQATAIPIIMEGTDVIGQAQTGTGKTGAFGIPVIEKLYQDQKHPQILILSPTRELAVQITQELFKLTKFKKWVKLVTLYGGQQIYRQISVLKRRPQIIIGTPGRVLDHINRRTLRLDNITTVVLDEADVMLDMGFRPEIDAIMEHIATEKQVLLFSATMPKEIITLTSKYQKDPVHIRTSSKNITVESIEQFYIEVSSKQKMDVIARILRRNEIKSSVIFCNTKRMVDELIAKVKESGFSAGALHGDMRQGQRDRTMQDFKSGKFNILIATDVAARGIDVKAVEAVFNYDVPKNVEYYVHRIGRTGRAGKSGTAYTLVRRGEDKQLKDIQNYTKSKMTRMDYKKLMWS